VRERFVELDVLRYLLPTIVKNDFKLKQYKKQKVHSLIEAQKAPKFQKCQQLLAWHAIDLFH
jgi:hypothetical protein